MKIIITFLAGIFLFNTFGKENIQPQEKFKLGNEVLIQDRSDLLKDKRVALLTNNSGVLSDGTSIVDAMHNSGSINVVKVFSPEHGFRGDDSDYDHTDAATGIQVVSLYGKNKQPTASELSDVDVIVYDIQDVSARFYTYISTMYYSMQSAADNGKKFIVCDRPIIPNPHYVDGFMLEDNVKSFIGSLNIPIAYGMTCGELANYINANLMNGACDLEVVKMSNYTRSMDYTSLELKWVKPSPSMYFSSTAVTYAGTCLLEGTNFAEGRGTDKPFEYVGAPYCNGSMLKEEMDKYNLPGVSFETIEFTPSAITSPSNPPKYVNQLCGGVYIKVTDKASFEPVKTGIALLVSLRKLFPQFEFRKDNYIDKLSGTKNLKTMVNDGNDLQEIVNYYIQELGNFKEKRKNYMLY